MCAHRLLCRAGRRCIRRQVDDSTTRNRALDDRTGDHGHVDHADDGAIDHATTRRRCADESQHDHRAENISAWHNRRATPDDFTGSPTSASRRASWRRTRGRPLRRIVTTVLGRASFAALGTGVTVATVDPDVIDNATAEVRAELDAFDRACSRFRADSDLSKLNQATTPTAVGGVLRDALAFALAAAEATHGAVDPTIGSSLRLLGYDDDFSMIERVGPPVVRFERAGGWQAVIFDRETGTVTLPRGVSIDLGATAKALASDRAASRAALAVGSGVLVSVGGDVALGGEPPDDGWVIRVVEHHAADDDAPGESIRLFDGGIATSTTTVRCWQRGDVAMHHIVDPATGQAAISDWRTVSVAAASCASANVASTAAIVLGDRATPWLVSLGVPCRVVTISGDVRYLGAWPRADAT